MRRSQRCTSAFRSTLPIRNAAYALGSKTSNAIVAALKKAGSRGQRNPERGAERRAGAAIRNPESARGPKGAAAVSGDAELVGEDLREERGCSARYSGAGRSQPERPDRLGRRRSRCARSAGRRERVEAGARDRRPDGEGLGATLGPLVYASNQVAERPMPMLRRHKWPCRRRPRPRAPPAPLAISPQKVTRSATVYAVFSIE